MYLDSGIYEMALEMAQPVTEINLGKGMKELLSDECRAGGDSVKEARKLSKSGDKSGAKKKYQEALNHFNKVRSNISKIGDESGWDWIISMFKPVIVFVLQGVYAEGNLKGLTRESSLKIIDDIIKHVKYEMNRL